MLLSFLFFSFFIGFFSNVFRPKNENKSVKSYKVNEGIENLLIQSWSIVVNGRQPGHESVSG